MKAYIYIYIHKRDERQGNGVYENGVYVHEKRKR